MRGVGAKLLTFAVATALGIAALEGGARLLYARTLHRPFDAAAIRARLRDAGPADGAALPTVDPALANDPRVADQSVILHPYFGYVANPEKRGVNAFGFFGPPPIATRGPDVALVAVIGGSVAEQLVAIAGETLRDRLADTDRFRGRRIEIINLALGGFKQPQQLIVLTTLLALGAQFDLVINLDGFNEIDGAKDNLQDGVYPFFPYAWNLHARQGFDRDTVERIARTEVIRTNRETLRRAFDRWPAPQSAFLLTLWDLLDRRQERALREATVALRQTLAATASSPQQRGPTISYADDAAMYADSVEVWARSSLEMAILCAGLGIRYAHVLQPNQYLAGSKALSEDEQQNAYDVRVAETGRVATAYPMLRARGRDLRDQGVPFTDLTMVFADEPRTVYADTCCHMNRLGNVLLAEAIARAVAH
jgi:hypothetical protein